MWIGDFVRCHTVIQMLRARFPDRPVDMLSTTLTAPLTDYMPGLRQAIVADLPRKAWPCPASSARRPPQAGKLRHRAGHAADLEVGAGAVPRRHPRAHRICRRSAVPPAQRFTFGERALPRMSIAAPRWPCRRARAAVELPAPQLEVPASEVAAWRDRAAYARKAVRS